jgi:endoglucanase
MSWDSVGGLALLSLVNSGSNIDKKMMESVRNRIIEGADLYLNQIDMKKYAVPLVNYFWGSNSQVLNKLIVMGYAYDITGEEKYIDAMLISMDYILGRNALCKSFISGYGENPMMYPHHRWWGNDPSMELPPPPPGVVAGGPNQDASDEGVLQFVDKVSPAMRYVDDAKSYSTNEVAINWNAPLVWVTTFIDEKCNSKVDVSIVGAGAEKEEGAFSIINSKYIYYILAGIIVILVVIAVVLVFVRKKKLKNKKD